ncbi:MAG: tetratricopeptide repeat protein, partial [Planctomycetota bacterium]
MKIFQELSIMATASDKAASKTTASKTTAGDLRTGDLRTGDTAVGVRAGLRRLTGWNPWIVLVAGILIAYHNSFAGKLAFDDHAYLGADKFTRLETLAAASNRPFLFWTLAANHRWGGSNAFGYHAVNLVIHLAASITLALLVRRLTANRLRGGTWLAIATALVWGVHPLTTQAVTYLIQRGESLASLFYLLALFAVARSADRPAGGGDSAVRAALWGLFAILCAWLGMLSKEIAGTLPLAAIVVDRVCFATSWGELLRRRSWLHIGMVSPWLWFSPWLATYVTGYVTRPSLYGDWAGVGWTPWQYFSNQPAVILHYLRLAIWPDRLCLDYAWQPADRFLDVAPAFAIMAFAGVATIVGLMRRRLWAVAGTGFFLVLAPSSSFLPIADLAFEHRMYLPLAFVAAIAVHGGYGVIAATAIHWNAARLGPPLFIALVAVASIGFAFRTVTRNRDYAEPARLWRSAIEINPRNYRAHSNLGCALYEEGNPRAAATAFTAALRLHRDDGHAWAGLAVSLQQLGELDEALRCFQHAIARLPRSAVAHNDMGVCLDQLGDAAAAELAFRRALELDPAFAIAAHNLGDSLLRRVVDAEAARWLEKAVQIDPRLAAARRKLAWLFATTADPRLRSPSRAEREFTPLLTRLPPSSGLSSVHSASSTNTGQNASRETRTANGLAAVRLLDTSAAIDASQGDFPRALERLDRALISLNIVIGTATDAKNAASMETNDMKAIIMESTAKAAMEL